MKFIKNSLQIILLSLQMVFNYMILLPMFFIFMYAYIHSNFIFEDALILLVSNANYVYEVFTNLGLISVVIGVVWRLLIIDISKIEQMKITSFESLDQEERIENEKSN